PTSADRFATQGERAGSGFAYRSLGFHPARSLVSVGPAGRHDPPSRAVGALASGRLSSLLALEIALTRRAHANRDRTARVDPADELGEFAFRRAFTANCSSLGLRSRSRASLSTWSSAVDRRAKAGGPFSETTRLTLPPWTFSW